MTALRWVILTIAEHEYGIDAGSVREVHDGLQALPMPGTADWFLGTAVVRGRVLPVSSLDAWLDPVHGCKRCGLTVEVTVGANAYLLAVSDVTQATESGDVDPVAGAAAPALTQRGVPTERRRLGGRNVDTFSVAALVGAASFTDIVARP